jgi:dihydropyrimidine dehydrogenase (NAD+) subunit PreT
VYRKGEADMPCYPYEYELAKKDGCGFRFNCTPLEITKTGLRVRTPTGEEIIRCDMVIKAIGQVARDDFAIPVNNPKVFLGGDCANGGAEIVNAAAEGKDAAKKIHAMFGGN